MEVLTPVGIRDSGFGTRDSGLGTRDSGFGIRDSGFEDWIPESPIPNPDAR
jgi:hypothetical protein